MATLAELLVKLGVDTSDLKSGMAEAPGEADKAVSGIKSKFDGLGDKLAPIAMAAGVAAGAAVVTGALVGIEREALSDKLAAQLDLSEEDSALAGQIAGSLYADAYGESLGQVNDAVGAVVGTLTDGLGDPAIVEGLTAKVLDFATAFDLDVVDAVARVGALMEGGLARDADHAMDLITASFQNVAPGLRDELADATREYSKHFGDLGISGEEAFGLLAAQDDQFSLDKTGDAIKELSIRATDGSTLTNTAFAEMGLSWEGMQRKLLAGGEEARGAFDEIVDGLLAIEDPGKQAETAIALFGTPLEDIGTAKIPDFLSSLDSMDTSLGDVSGAADRMGETLNTNAQTRITGYKRSIEGALAAIVGMPGPIGVAAGAAGAFGSVVAPIAPMLSGLAVVFQGPLSAAMSAIGGHITGLIKKSGAFVLSQIKTAGTFVAKWVLMGAQSLLHAAKVAAAWLIAMGPIALVIAAVVGLVALIIANWDTIKEVIGKAWEVVKRATSAAWDWVKGAVKKVVDFLVNLFLNFTLPGLIIKHWDAIKDGVRNVTDFIKDTWNNVIDFFKELPGKIGNAVAGMWDGIKDAFRSAINWIINKWNDLEISIGGGSILGVDIPKITVRTPNIPTFHDGGVMPGPPGSQGLALLEAGETVLPAGQGGNTINVYTVGTGERLFREAERVSAYALALGG